ncbi:hypothetical protein THAOC_18045, partial [Thalassiosira oceanica]
MRRPRPFGRTGTRRTPGVGLGVGLLRAPRRPRRTRRRGRRGDEELAAFDLEGAGGDAPRGPGGGRRDGRERSELGRGGPARERRARPRVPDAAVPQPGHPAALGVDGGRKKARPPGPVRDVAPPGRRRVRPEDPPSPPGNAAYESLVSSSRGRVAEGALKERGLAGGGVVYELLDEETVLAKIRAGLRERPAAAATTANGKGKTANGNGKSSAGPAAVSRSSVSSSSAPSGADGPPAKRPRSSSASSRSSGAPGPDGKSPEVEFVGSTEEVEFLGSREPAAAGYNPLLARRALAATRLGGRTEEQTGAPTGSREAGGVSDVAAPGSVRPAAAGYNPLAAREALRLAASLPGEGDGGLEGPESAAAGGYNPLAARRALATNRPD